MALGRELWRDPARRASFVETVGSVQADATVGVNPELAALFETCRAENGAETTPVEESEAAEQIERIRTCVVAALEAQRQLGLLNHSVFELDRFRASWTAGRQWLLRPFKLVMVATALFLGAPFWYDVVRRLAGVRRTSARSET